MKYLLMDTNIYVNLIMIRDDKQNSELIDKIEELITGQEIILLIPDLIKSEFERTIETYSEKIKILPKFDFQKSGWNLINTQKNIIIMKEISDFLDKKRKEIIKENTENINELRRKIIKIFDLGLQLKFKDKLLINALKSAIYVMPPCHEKRFEASADSLILEFLIDFIDSKKFNVSDEIIFVTRNYKDFSDNKNITNMNSKILEKIKCKTNKFIYRTSLLPIIYNSIDKTKNPNSCIWPVPSSFYISSFYNLPNENFGISDKRYHKGIDIAAKNGSKVIASLEGTIISAGYKNGYGNTVVIKHDNNLKTLYAHLSSIEVVADEMVEKGKVIGCVGSTGMSTGPHLHFELIKNDISINPLDLVEIY